MFLFIIYIALYIGKFLLRTNNSLSVQASYGFLSTTSCTNQDTPDFVCSVTYTPDENWNGTINISYTITDTNDLSSTSNITVIVNPVNDPPVTTDFTNGYDYELDEVWIPFDQLVTDLESEVIEDKPKKMPKGGEI